SGLDVSNTSDGQDWGTVHYIPGLGGLVDKDSIAFDSAGRLYAAWDEGNTLALSWSDDDGTHWAPIRNPGNGGHSVLGASGATSQWMVDLAVDSRGTVHAAWEDGRADNWNIFYSNSTNGGATWAANLRVSSEDTPGSYNRPGDYFAIEVGFDDSVNIVWTDGRGDDFDIFFARNPGFPTATITVTTSPVGLPVTVDGITMPSPVQETWLTGSAHDI